MYTSVKDKNNHADLGHSLVHNGAGSTFIRLFALPKVDHAYRHRPKGKVHAVFYSDLPHRKAVPDYVQSLRTPAQSRRQSSCPVGDLGKNRKISRTAKRECGCCLEQVVKRLTTRSTPTRCQPLRRHISSILSRSSNLPQLQLCSPFPAYMAELNRHLKERERPGRACPETSPKHLFLS